MRSSFVCSTPSRTAQRSRSTEKKRGPRERSRPRAARRKQCSRRRRLRRWIRRMMLTAAWPTDCSWRPAAVPVAPFDVSTGSDPDPFARHPAMAAICAQRTTGVDVNRTLRIATVDVAFGRIARLQGSPREGPESGAKRKFRVCALIARLRGQASVRKEVRTSPETAVKALKLSATGAARARRGRGSPSP
jgi:hypothetical protein